MFRCYSYTIIRERIFYYIYINICLTTVTLASTINALPDEGVTVTPKHVGAVLM